MGDHRLGIVLEVVGRERVLLLGHERLEEPPGAPGHEPERARLARREAWLFGELHRNAQPPGQNGRQAPEQHQRAGHRPRARLDHGEEHARTHGEEHAPAKVPVEGAQLQVDAVSGLRGRDPFEEMSLGDVESAERAHHGVGHVPGVVRQRGDRKQCLQRSNLDVSARRAQVIALGEPLAPRDQTVEHRHERRQGDGAQEQTGPQQR
jgi:hypothetical protein